MGKENLNILFLAPHLSTGGMPAFLLKRIESLSKYTNANVSVLEWCDYSHTFVVQKNKIIELVGDNYYNFGSLYSPEKGIHGEKKDLIEFLYEKKFDIIHIEEIPEGFDSFNPFDKKLLKKLYNKKHPWKIVETCHNMYFDPDKDKLYEPDGYACVTQHHIDKTFKNRSALKSLISFPIDKSIQSKKSRDEILDEMGYLKKGEFHIINIGLWTPGKNQKYALNIAKSLYEKYGFTYIFHFLGNQAPNFEEYWKPLMKDIPPNVNIWGERNDIDKFFGFADLMLFTSDWECNPIVLKEAISNNTKIMAFNLDHYGNEYLPYIVPLTNDVNIDKHNLIDTIFSPIKYKLDNIKNTPFNFAIEHLNFYKTILEKNEKRK